MRTPATVVPAFRDDLAVKKYGDKLVVEDALRRVRVPIDALTLQVVQALADGPQPPDMLAQALSAPRAELWRRVSLLNAHGLLETPRAAAQCALHADAAAREPWPKDALGDAPLRFPGGLQHGCVACGACCHGTDVGPLKPDDIAKVQEIDWSPHLPDDVDREDWLVETEAPGGQTVTLMGMRHGRCVFLDGDKLCVIHKVAGADQKPTICRQFPYTFTRTPDGIDVSFSMECRAWWQARLAGSPPAEDEAGIRKLVAEGGPVVDLPPVVSVWTGIDCDHAAWGALREELIAGVTAAPDVAAIVAALVGPTRALFARLVANDDDSELFAERVAWGVPEGPAPDAVAAFGAQLAALRGRVADGLSGLARAFHEAGRGDEGDRTARLRWALEALLDGRQVEDLLRLEHETEIWRDMVLAALYAHDPARRDYLLSGISHLVLRVLAGQLLAGLLAQVGLRGRTSEQDVVDSMVLLTKMLRGSAFSQLLGRARGELVGLFVWNAEVFSVGAPPRAPHPRLDIR
ncbi:MAG: YkgJ family cysteine cluster protein [Myxococcales bacterium]|nr:YkgJ family cysteine cluster protein [Myxococcales bacterium]MCB9734600.1 YkgJ family cysteine cluster protein [Deltaproteobacteria bacterium]